MAGRIRSLKPELLDDEVGANLSDAAWRMWVSARALADDHGNLRANVRYLAAQVWQDTSRDAGAPLAELVDRGKVLLYTVDGQVYAHLNGWELEQRVDNAGKPRVPLPPRPGDQPPRLLAAAPVAAEKSANLGESPQLAESLGESPRTSEACGEPPRLAANLGESPKVAEACREPPQVSESLGESPQAVETVGESPRTSANLGEPPQVSEVRGLTGARGFALPDLRPPTSDHDPEEEEEKNAREGAGPRRALKCDRKRLVLFMSIATKSVPHTRLMNACASIGDHKAAADPTVDATEYAIKFVETYAEWRKRFPMPPAWSPDAIERHATTVQRIMSGEEDMPTALGLGGKNPKRDLRRGRAPVSDWSDPT